MLTSQCNGCSGLFSSFVSKVNQATVMLALQCDLCFVFSISSRQSIENVPRKEWKKLAMDFNMVFKLESSGMEI